MDWIKCKLAGQCNRITMNKNGSSYVESDFRTVPLTDRYQTTIPEVVRNVLNLSKRDKLVYSVDSDGKVVISKLTSCEDDPVLNNFLTFLVKDIEHSPQNLVPM